MSNPNPENGALREAIARSLIAEQLAEAALGELARVADFTQDQAAAGLVTVAEWIPGEQITDEQCEAFIGAAEYAAKQEEDTE